MPIIVKDYTWQQTADVITVQVPLRGVHYSKVDIFTSHDYIKASFQPFIFEVFLSSTVNDTESKCIKAEGELVFELQKTESGTWSALEADLTTQEMNERRISSIQRYQEKAQAEAKAKAEKRSELDRLAVRKQIALDTCRRNEIQEMKDTEKNIAMRDLQVWKANQSNNTPTNLAITDNLESGGNKPNPVKRKSKKKSVVPVFRKPSEFITNLKKKEEIPLPPTRDSGSIRVSFTPRVFPTPSRESQHPLEEEWLKKQAEARRKIGFVAEDLTPEERDPIWLKEKGDSFFKVNNYLGAISAYSHAIKLGSKLPALFSNRAAAHMALGNLQRGIEDCSTALELLTPCVDLNAEARARCHARRATALCRVGLARHGVADLEAALKIQPDNEELRQDLEKARDLMDADRDSSD